MLNNYCDGKETRMQYGASCGFLVKYTVLWAWTPFWTVRFRVELTVGPALRLRAKVTVVEDPQAPLPDYILHSVSRLHQDTLKPQQSSFTLSFVLLSCL